MSPNISPMNCIVTPVYRVVLCGAACVAGAARICVLPRWRPSRAGCTWADSCVWGPNAMRSSLSSSPLTGCEDPGRLWRPDRSPSRSCCGDTGSDPLLHPPHDLLPRNDSGLLVCGFCASWVSLARESISI